MQFLTKTLSFAMGTHKEAVGCSDMSLDGGVGITKNVEVCIVACKSLFSLMIGRERGMYSPSRIAAFIAYSK